MSQISLTRSSQDKRQAIIIAVVAIVGIAALVFFLRNSADAQHAKLVNRAFTNLVNAESYHTNTQLDLQLPVQLQNRERPIVNVTMRVDGDVQYQDNRPVLTGNLYTEARGRGMVLFSEGDVRVLPNDVAFRLSSLPTLLNPSGNLVNKWTYVNVPTLETRNPEQVRSTFSEMLQGMTYVGESELPDTSGGQEMNHYTRTFTPEQENAMVETFRQANSGNRGLHVVARLLRAFDITSFDTWVDPRRDQVRMIQVTFKKPTASDQPSQGATLRMAFSDYGKEVVIDEPPKELTVRPDIFAQMFGRGEIGSL